MKVKSDHRSKFSNLSNWKEEAWKKSGLQRDSNPWPPRYRCDALPTELCSHTLGASYWVHIFPCSEMMRSLYEIIRICTAVVDESEEWPSQWIFQFKHLLERRSLKNFIILFLLLYFHFIGMVLPKFQCNYLLQRKVKNWTKITWLIIAR